jgi:IPT/TIG domain
MHRQYAVILSLAVSTACLTLAEPARAAPAQWNFTNMKPTVGPWGTTVRLRGYGFDRRSVKVYFDGQLVKPKAVSKRVIVVKVPVSSRSGWFEVHQAGKQLRSPMMFKIKNKAALTSMTPTSGPPGIWVTVKGVHFHNNVRFWIGRSRVRRRHVNATTYKLLIHKSLKSGRLFWASAKRKSRTRFVFKIANYPVLQSFSPQKGYFGDRVTLKGVSFCPRAKVYLDGQAVTVVHRMRDRKLVVKLRKGVRTGRLEVECFGKRVTHATEFLVEPPFAEIRGISPAAGSPRRWITVVGVGFTRKSRFWLGNRTLRKKFVSSREVKVFIPAGARMAKVYFQSFGKRFMSTFSYRIYRPPVITGFRPTAAWFGQYVTLQGRNFCPMVKVWLGGRSLPVIRREGNNRLVVQVPRGATAAKFSVRCLKWRASSPGKLRLQAPKAGVSGVSPRMGPPGSRVVVTGFNLRPADKFFLGRVRLPAAYESSTRVSLTLPRAARTGLLVHESFGRRIRTRFRIVVGWPKPQLLGFAPKVAWFNEVITLKGKKICDGPIVRLGGKVVPVVNSTHRSIEITVPRGSKGGAFSVKCHNHKVRLAGRLRIVAPFAQITSIYPKAGPWGTWITLTGRNFRKGDRFWLGRVPFRQVRRMSGVEMRVKVPKRAGTGKIIVLSRGRRTVTNHQFRLAFPTPVISRLTPRRGWWGDYITIKGKHFCKKPVVRFGKRVSYDLLRMDRTTIKARVPKRAFTGTVEVRCFGKVGRSAKTFKVVKPKPRIVDVFPDRGPPKKWITITGRNLDRIQKMWVNHRRYGRVELVLKKISKIKLQAYIPAGCKGGALEIMAYKHRKTTSFAYIVPRKYRKP